MNKVMKYNKIMNKNEAAQPYNLRIWIYVFFQKFLTLKISVLFCFVNKNKGRSFYSQINFIPIVKSSKH